MNKASFLSLVRETSRISDQDAEALEQLVVNFPYCQTAHLLIAKAAYDRGSMLSNQKLKKAAIYATNRQLLKKLIYTSDATVALHPLAPLETDAETGQKVSAFVQNATENPIKTPSAANETPGSPKPVVIEKTAPEEQMAAEETIARETSRPEEPLAPEEAVELAEEVVIAESLPETLPEIEPETDSIARTEDQEKTDTTEVEKTETPEIPEAAILAEEVAIAEEFAETAELQHPSSAETLIEPSPSEPEAGTALVTEPELTEIQGEVTTEKQPEAEALEIPEEVILAEEVAIADAILGTSETTQEENANGPSAENQIAEISQTETIAPEAGSVEFQPEAAAETLPEPTEKLPEYHQLPADADTTLQEVADLHEMQLTDEPHPVAHSVSALHDDLLQETLASFDQYLFKPEKETEETAQVEDLKVVYPENEIEAIHFKDSIGYWMNSSRMGESLEVKDDLTTQKPFEFHPELLLEYTKTHELEKQLKPAPSVLSRQLDIIDQFLKLSPKLKAAANMKIRTEAQEDLSQKSTKINKNLASENFANILVQQGKIKKAIKIYEHLILKIPEKKAYFVAQIEKLQNQE